MSKKIELDDAIFRLEMLTETFMALEQAVENSESELPIHFLFSPIRELKKISNELNNIISKP